MSKLGLEKQRNQRSNCQHSLDHRESKGIPEKNIYLSFMDYNKAFDCVDHNKLWKVLKEIGITDHLTSLLRNLYAGQKAAVRTLYGTTNWFHIEKVMQQGCLLSPCWFYLYAEHNMKNARLDELEAGIKTGETSTISDMQMHSNGRR